MVRKLLSGDPARIVTAYRLGQSTVKELAKEYGCSRSNIYRIINSWDPDAVEEMDWERRRQRAKESIEGQPRERTDFRYKHGTWQRYRYEGCNEGPERNGNPTACDDCRKAHAKKSRSERSRLRERMDQGQAQPEHGKNSTYVNYGAHECPPPYAPNACAEAHARAQREYMARRRA